MKDINISSSTIEKIHQDAVRLIEYFEKMIPGFWESLINKIQMEGFIKILFCILSVVSIIYSFPKVKKALSTMSSEVEFIIFVIFYCIFIIISFACLCSLPEYYGMIMYPEIYAVDYIVHLLK